MNCNNVHHRGDEAFYVLDGRLDVQDCDTTHRLEAGGLHVDAAGSAHTFATVDDGPVRALVVPRIGKVAVRHDSSSADASAAICGGPTRQQPPT